MTTGAVFDIRDDRGDGTDLRDLTFDGARVASRLYFAVRAPQWRTLPLTVLDRTFARCDNGFALTVVARTGSEALPFDVTLEYRASGGRLTARFDGVAGADLDYNRIGFCLLQPIPEHAGRSLTLRTAAGDLAAAFPLRIEPQVYVDGAPHPLFDAQFTGMSTTTVDGLSVDVALHGDEFEIEDQRNWSDASFKTYSTPMHLGFPRRAEAGRRFGQRVEIAVARDPGAPSRPPVEATVRVGEAVGRLPAVGLYEPGEPAGTWRPRTGFSDLNRTRPSLAELGDPSAVAVGVNGSQHADDRWSIAQTAAIHGTMARQIASLYPGLELRLRPLAFSSPAGNWLADDLAYTHTPRPDAWHPLRAEPYAAAWVIGSLASLAGAPVTLADYFDAKSAGTPAGDLIAELAPLAGRPVHAVEAPPGVGALAVDTDAGVRLYLSNATDDPVTLGVEGAGDMELEPFGWRSVDLPVPSGDPPPG